MPQPLSSRRPRIHHSRVTARTSTLPSQVPLLLLTLLALALLALLPAGRANADYLVTKTGQRIEIEGTYEVDGRRVLYRQLSGNLTAIRLSEIDLEATEAANRAPVIGKPDVEARLNQPNWIEQARRRVDGEPVMVIGEGDRDQEEIVEQMTELVREMGSSMEEAFGAFDANGEMDEVFAEMGNAMGGAMEEAAGAMGSMMGAMLELSLDLESKMQGFEKRHDLRTESGMRAAAPEIADMAEHVRKRADSEADPMVRQMLDEMAASLRAMMREIRDHIRENRAAPRATGRWLPGERARAPRARERSPFRRGRGRGRDR